MWDVVARSAFCDAAIQSWTLLFSYRCYFLKANVKKLDCRVAKSAPRNDVPLLPLFLSFTK